MLRCGNINMKNSLKYFLILIIYSSLLFLPSCTTVKTVNNIDTAEELNYSANDGFFLINNRNNDCNSIINGKTILIANKTPYIYTENDISLWIFGSHTEDLKDKISVGNLIVPHTPRPSENFLSAMIEESKNKEYKEYLLLADLSEFEYIGFSTLNGRIIDYELTKENGCLKIGIKSYDIYNLSSEIVRMANETKKKNAEAYKHLLSTIKKTGEKLYKQKILPVQDKSIPIFINSFKTSNGVLEEDINVVIEFLNVYDKVIKYVDFEVVPYNRVNDIAYSNLDYSSKKVIQSVNFIQPNQKYTASWKAVWYNNTISYMKIVGVKVTFEDNSVITMNEQAVARSFSKKELSMNIENDLNMDFSAHYIVGENSFYIQLKDSENNFRNFGSNPPFSCEFNLDPYQVGDKTIQSVNDSCSQKNRNTYTVSFSSLNRYDNEELIIISKSGFIKINEKVENTNNSSLRDIYYPMHTIKLTETQLNFIRQCLCIQYYMGTSVQKDDTDNISKINTYESMTPYFKSPVNISSSLLESPHTSH